jgi:hypothetical protein
MTKMNLKFTFLVAVFCVALVFPSVANAQRRDYLTEAEIELVRDAQEIDLRITVLTKAVDRRIAVVKKETPKESEKWGELPTGTNLELFTDIQKILQKAIDDIDDIARREGNKMSNLFPKAVHKLADKCREYQPQFKAFLDNVPNEKERGALLTSIDLCDQVLDASTRVPKEVEKKKKKN